MKIKLSRKLLQEEHVGNLIDNFNLILLPLHLYICSLTRIL